MARATRAQQSAGPRGRVASKSAWYPGKGEQTPGAGPCPGPGRRRRCAGVTPPAASRRAPGRRAAPPVAGKAPHAALPPVGREAALRRPRGTVRARGGRGPGRSRASRARSRAGAAQASRMRFPRRCTHPVGEDDRRRRVGRSRRSRGTSPRGRRMPAVPGLSRGRFRLSGRRLAEHAEQRSRTVRNARADPSPKDPHASPRGKAVKQYAGRYRNQPSRLLERGTDAFGRLFA